jgi:hypothetical protein
MHPQNLRRIGAPLLTVARLALAGGEPKIERAEAEGAGKVVT